MFDVMVEVFGHDHAQGIVGNSFKKHTQIFCTQICVKSERVAVFELK